VLGKRLKRFRLARGMSLGDLEAAIDGLVSSQALSKYEHGKLQPTVRVLNRIASALGVKSVQLWGEPPVIQKPNTILIRRWIRLLTNHLVNVVSFCNYRRRRDTVS